MGIWQKVRIRSVSKMGISGRVSALCVFVEFHVQPCEKLIIICDTAKWAINRYCHCTYYCLSQVTENRHPCLSFQARSFWCSTLGFLKSTGTGCDRNILVLNFSFSRDVFKGVELLHQKWPYRKHRLANATRCDTGTVRHLVRD